MDNIELFDLNKEALNSIITEIKNKLATVNQLKLNEIDAYKEEIIKVANDKLKGSQAEFVILAILMDSYIYPPVIDWIKRKNSRNNIVNVLYIVGVFTLAFYGLGVLIWIFAWWYSKQD